MKWGQKKNKYGAKRCVIDGVSFPSLLEGEAYKRLKFLQKAGEFKLFLMQIPFSLPGGFKHKIDFCVFGDNWYKFIEIKGRDLPIGRMKRLQCEDIYGIQVHVAKNMRELNDIITNR